LVECLALQPPGDAAPLPPAPAPLPAPSPLQIYAGYQPADVALLQEYATETAVILDDLLVDGFGTRTPRENVAFCDEFRAERLQLPVPDDGFHAEAIEYIALIDALRRAPADRFNAVEIGAAWGPWLSMGGVVARRAGKQRIGLVGVEADPDRFRQLQRQMAANQLQDCRLIQGAAGAKPGTLWFPKLAITDLGAAAAAEQRAEDYRGAAIESHEVRAYTLEEILADVDFVDFLHVDIQGGEYELLAANAGMLRDRVAAMLIGTHSRVIEGQLIALLDADWALHREKPCRVDWSAAAPELSGRTINDGCQYWLRRPRDV
jgi:FkbM family methyltransferase